MTDNTAARIAELAAWRDAAIEQQRQRKLVEAERDKLKAELQALYDDCADYIKINRLMRGDGASAIHNQVMVQARAALSEEKTP
jgi:hypothetical protein